MNLNFFPLVKSFFSPVSTRPAVPTELWSSQLRSEAAGGEEGRRRKKKEKGRKEKVLLIKSRDPHLAGGEKCMDILPVPATTCGISPVAEFLPSLDWPKNSWLSQATSVELLLEVLTSLS